MDWKQELKKQGISVDTFESQIAWSGFHLNPQGLIPVIVQDYKTSEVLMLAYETVSDEARIEEIKHKALQAGYSPDYYVYSDTAAQALYSLYQRNESGHNIWILGEDQTVKELSTISPLVHAVCHEKLKEDRKVYYPKEIL